jgi:L-ascorbate metabolism protein UlaG (beta-lactamase superfamily)
MLTRLDQSGFIIEAPEGRFAFDLYLSDHLAAKYRGTNKPHDRLHPPACRPSELTGLDWIFASHKHSDHLDPGSIRDVLAASPDATLLLPASLAGYARDELGVEEARIWGAAPGERVGPFTLLAAAHPDPGPQHLSTVLEVDGLRIFHSGDTLTFAEQERALRAVRPHVLLVPANGRVAEHLGTPPNMSLEEAVELASACGAKLVVPHHYDLFAFNSRPRPEVTSVLAASGLQYRVLSAGGSVRLDRDGKGVAVTGVG